VLIVVMSVAGVTALLPAAGLVLLVTVALAFAVGTALDGRIAAASDDVISTLRGRVVDLSMSLVRTADLLTAYGAMPASLAELDRADAELRSAALRRSAATGAVTAALGMIGGAAVLGAAIVAQPALASGSLTGPQFAVLVLVPLAVFEAVSAVPLAAGSWRRVRASAARVASVAPATVPPEIPLDGIGAELARPEHGVSIRVRELSARWPGATSDSVTGVSVTIEPGERLLVSGDSGAGKSTLASVLVRFITYAGSVTINGVEVSELEPMSVRRVIGLCEQRPHIFDDTIRQNVLFADETATDEELLEVLDRVGLREWVLARGGLDARVGERGALVSGGQAQRIAVARALLADFPVLILDEPTASVDPEQADDLMRDILGAASSDGRSVIVLSHLAVPDELVTQRLTIGRGARTEPGD
jgi:ATP-binding cassette, subfamily C, bacterial CydC